MGVFPHLKHHGVHAFLHNAELLGEGQEGFATFECGHAVFPACHDDVVEEGVGEGDEVILSVVFAHVQVVGRAYEGSHVGGRELHGERVTELCDHFKGMGSTRHVSELHPARVHTLVVLIGIRS